MFSRWLLVLILPFLVVSCSFDTKDAENKQTLKVADSSSNLKCINRDVVKLLDSGLEKFDEPRAHKAFDCIIFAIDIIDSHINVKNQDDIKIASVKKLVKKKVKNYSEDIDKVIDVFFDAKVKTLKGKSDRISHQELKMLKLFINDLRSLYINFFPVMELMATNASANVLPTEVSSAIYKLNKAENIFYNIFTKYKISVSRSEIESWLSVSNIFKDEERKNKWELYWSFHQMMWPKHSDITFKNVSYWLDGVRSVFSWAIKKRHLWTMQNYMTGETTHDVLSSTDEIMLFVQRAINNKSSKTIYYSEINTVIDYFEKIFGFPRGLTGETVKKMVPILVEKLISVPHSLRQKQAYKDDVYGEVFKPHYPGFTMEHFNNLLKEYEIYKNIQLAIAGGDITRSKGKVYDGAYSRHLTHFASLIQQIHPYFPDENIGLFIGKKDDPARYNSRNLSMMNMYRVLARAIAMGYTSNSGRLNMYTGITVKEFEKFMSEFEVFFGEVYIMEKRGTSASVANRVYMESKLFVGTGDGYKTSVVNGVKQKSLISFVQAVEVIANYSSGMFSIKSIFEELLEKCEAVSFYNDDEGRRKSLVTFNRPGITKQCFKENYVKILIKNVDNLPNLQNYLETYLEKKATFKKKDNEYTLEDNLIYSGQEEKNLSNAYISYVDISIIGTFLSFIESVFLKYDIDENSLIDKDEVETSFEYFREFIEAKGYAQCSGVQFRHLLLYKSEGNGFQKVKTGTSCLGKYFDHGFNSSKNWVVNEYNKAKDSVVGKYNKAKDTVLKIIKRKGVEGSEPELKEEVYIDEENELAKQRLLDEAEQEVLEASKKDTRINRDHDLSVDRGEILQILTFMKRDAAKKKKK